jgi:hypothetical protein
LEHICQKPKKKESFHHSAIQRILNIKWYQVRTEKKIRNYQMRHCFCNVPKIETYALRKTLTYVGKIIRSKRAPYPKNSSVPGCTAQRKGGPQLSCNNNFVKAISALVPDQTFKNHSLKKWVLLALNKTEWMSFIKTVLNPAR